MPDANLGTLYRGSRVPITVTVPPTLGSPTTVDVVLLPKRTRPGQLTVWTMTGKTVTNGQVTVEVAGPDASATGALVASDSSDMFMRATTPGGDVLIDKVGRVYMRDGAGVAASLPPNMDALIGAYLNSHALYPHA